MKVHLLYFQGCPNVDAARAALRAAIAAENADAAIEEIDVEAPGAPYWARGWGSATILVDGEDVAGQARSTESSCRLYANGAPDVEMIRGRLTARDGAPKNGARLALPLVGAVTAAIAASACCLVPAVLAIVGMSGAGFASRFAPYRVYFLIATGLSLALGFWFAYHRRADACGCAVPRSRKAARVALWITMVVAIGLAAYPWLGSGSATAGSIEQAAKATLRLKVTGMDCKECASTIAHRLEKIPGVISATVDYESEHAVIRSDGREGMARAAVAAVEDAGYRAEVQP